ncbi:hypothetical protein JTB14_030305 [Gonioctena quinquepunctata]|nr:hypothetical protein JTB14_030305 [Gonioctena quinquepunctata]
MIFLNVPIAFSTVMRPISSFVPKIKTQRPKDSKHDYEVDGAKAKSSLMVIFTFSAPGITTPPLIIYPYKRLPKYIADCVPSELSMTLVTGNDTGWMETEIFYDGIAVVTSGTSSLKQDSEST